MKSPVVKVLVFLFLLFVVNKFLLSDGLWLSGDNAYWFKNNFEAHSSLMGQLQAFSRSLYYMGYDPGLFNYTHIVISLFQYILVLLFGSVASQVIFILSGYFFVFIAFYLFLSIFFKDSQTKYLLSLIYTFNPLTYSFQSLIIMNCALPLFIYTLFKYLESDNRRGFKYMLINVVSLFLIISYIRFIEIAFFVISAYLFYLFKVRINTFNFKKIMVLGVFYFLTLAPVLFSLIFQIAEKSKTAFYYGELLGETVSRTDFYYAFDLLKSFDLYLFENRIFTFFGISLFIFIIFKLIKFSREKFNNLYFVNISLVLLGMLFFGLDNLLGDFLYKFLIRFLPFIVHSPWWALYIVNIPLIILIGQLTLQNRRHLYIYSSIFLVLSITPYVFYGQNKIFNKFKLMDIPKAYSDYFFVNNPQVPIATNYIPGMCWIAQYMEEQDQAAHCINFGYEYSPIAYENPRILSDKYFSLSRAVTMSDNLNNLRVTHNLKHIIVPNDSVDTNNPNLALNSRTGTFINRIKNNLDKSILLSVNKNVNFNDYFFTGLNDYDFFIYAPLAVVNRNLESIFEGQIDIEKRPVVFSDREDDNSFQDSSIFYKISPENPTKYLLKLSIEDLNKPIVIQMNQTFSSSWKAIWVDKESFDKAECVSGAERFIITNNQYCKYSSNGLEFQDIALLTKKHVPESSHFEGNLIGNTWIINKDDVPSENRSRDLYLILIFEKQIYYKFMIFVSFISFLILIGGSVISEVRRNFNLR